MFEQKKKIVRGNLFVDFFFFYLYIIWYGYKSTRKTKTKKEPEQKVDASVLVTDDILFRFHGFTRQLDNCLLCYAEMKMEISFYLI